MPIYLPGDIQFTDQDDVAPMSWDMPQAILNWGNTYTLAGNDLITGTSSYFAADTGGAGFVNGESGTINTGNGRDVITGQGLDGEPYGTPSYYGYGIDNRGTIETGNDGDYFFSNGTFYNSGMVSLGDGNDEVYAELRGNVTNNSLYTLVNYGTIEAGNGDDFLNVIGRFNNSGSVSLGHGNDSISISGNGYNTETLINSQTIETGDGDDRITTRVMENFGFINTGNGKDSLIARNLYGSGNVFLGDGDDYLSGFGSGYYDGGNDQDFLELTSGDYIIGISGGIVSFTKNGYNQTMQTSGFEKLIAGNTTYDFTSLSDGLLIYIS
jgi:hypothetical protein